MVFTTRLPLSMESLTPSTFHRQAYVCAIATVTRRGILVKSAGSLELLSQCGTVALDKTGAQWGRGGELLSQCGTVALDKTRDAPLVCRMRPLRLFTLSWGTLHVVARPLRRCCPHHCLNPTPLLAGTLTTGSLTLTDTVRIHCGALSCSSGGGSDTSSLSDPGTPSTQSSSSSPFVESPLPSSSSSSSSSGTPRSENSGPRFSLTADSSSNSSGSSSRSSLGGSGTFSLGSSGAGSDVPLGGTRAVSREGFEAAGKEPGCSGRDEKLLPGSGEDAFLGTAAMQYCVALSRASNHPVSRAVVQAATAAAAAAAGAEGLAEGSAEVQVSMFEQVCDPPGVEFIIMLCCDDRSSAESSPVSLVTWRGL